MSLNRNAKGLKSDKRLEREYFRRDEYMDFENHTLPVRPRHGDLWTVDPVLDTTFYTGAKSGVPGMCLNKGLYFLVPDVCMHCWSPVYPHEEKNGGGSIWMHGVTHSIHCYRKATLTVEPMPGIYVIEELEL